MGFLDFLGTSGGSALAQGAAGLFGGLFKKSDPKPYTRNQMWLRQSADREWYRNRNLSREFARNSTGWQMKDIFRTADQSGIHRLAALGGASGYQPTGMSVGGGLGPGPTDQSNPFMGDAISDALNMYVRGEEAKHRREMDEAQLELLKAQSKTLEADARRTETGTALATEGILGTQMEADAGERNERAGGNILGEIQTIWEWAKATQSQTKGKEEAFKRKYEEVYGRRPPTRVLDMLKRGKSSTVSHGISPHFKK